MTSAFSLSPERFEPESLPYAIGCVVALIAALCLLWLLSERLNRATIRRHVERQGYRFIWAKGLFTFSRCQKYQVHYQDGQGAVYSAECVVELFRVYLGNGMMIQPAPRERNNGVKSTGIARAAIHDVNGEKMRREYALIVEENRRLAMELERLRGGKKEGTENDTHG